MKKLTAILLVLCSICSLYASGGHSKKATPTGGYYWEFLPEAYTQTTRTYPTILFLHGCGKIAYRNDCSSPIYTSNPLTELDKMLSEGIPKEIHEGSPMAFTFEVNGQLHTDTFIVISPQLNGQNATSWTAKNIEGWVKYVFSNYRVDKTRFYITGLSLGGRGAFDYAKSTNPVRYFADSLAAIVPVAAKPTSPTNPCLIAQRNIPVKSYHGTDDIKMPYNTDVNFLNDINNCTPPPDTLASLVSFPGVAHSPIVWNTAYETSAPPATNMYHWLLRQKRGGYTNVLPVVSAGPDITVQLPANSISITGTASDPDGNITGTLWTQTGGPAVTFSSNQGVLTVSGMTAGTYTFRFSATDNEGESSFDEVTVIVNNAYSPGSWLEITANSAAGKSIALYFDSQKSNAVQQAVRNGGNDYLSFYVQTLTGTPNWNALKVELTVSYQTKSLAIGSYVSTTVQNGWQRVEIPLSAFGHDAVRWTSGGVSLVAFKAASGLGNVVFGVDEIGFTGGSTPFVWYGDTYETSGSTAAVTESSTIFIISNRLTSGGYMAAAARHSAATVPVPMTAFPNPANEWIDAGRTDVLHMELWRTDGVLIRKVDSEHRLYVEDIAQGMYVLHYTLENGETLSERILIRH